MVLLATVASAMTVCGGGSSQQDSDGGAESVGTFTGFEIRLTLDKEEYSRGEPVEMTLSLTNTHDHIPVGIEFSDAQHYDFQVSCRPPADCPQVWRWSRDKAFIQFPGLEVVSPGRLLSYVAVWDQRDAQGRQVPPGTYEARGFITGCLERDPGTCDFGPGPVVFDLLP